MTLRLTNKSIRTAVSAVLDKQSNDSATLTREAEQSDLQRKLKHAIHPNKPTLTHLLLKKVEIVVHAGRPKMTTG